MKRRVIGIVVAVVVIGGVFLFVLPKIADYRAVWETITDLTWEQLLLLLGVTVLNIVTFAPPFMATLPGLGFIRALVLTQASTASTYIAPGGAAVGMALSFAMLRAWGFEPAAVTLAVALTGAWNQMFLLGAPALALALLTLAGGANRLLQTVALIGLVVFVVALVAFALALSGDKVARWAGDLSARVATWGLRLMRRKGVDVERRVARRVPRPGGRPAATPVVDPDPRDARRAAQRFPRAAHVPAHARRDAGAGLAHRGVRRLDARAPARLAARSRRAASASSSSG